ncbi:MAG TPA: M20 aminoacylase family protein [Aliidongia sp.]|uniref:M20 aminoacylase family protein n=1 Tax=Aliidongia sp. TaxID=1914230 RepID=UPI002DDC9CAA|nr:M20 aminoacylase family protein [Aliidongia sp.]HEV2673626.1 M20 aminoacylase family protein [Aliidongia sp.]
MPINNRIADFHADLTAWRRDIHAHPEIAFEEHRTAALVAAKLEEFGIEVHRGLAGTGVVGTLRGNQPGERTIALRADMDALPMPEANDFEHASTAPGKMHACGHDGHTVMLLGAARYLAETRNFAGTVHFVFQPAEEGGGGGRVMVEEGLFDKFPTEEVYGMHNWPGLPAGQFAGRVGPVMAATDQFEITIEGRGGHAAQPHKTVDPVVVGSQVVGALQTIASRNADPIKSVVVSVTQFHAGSAFNVIPQSAWLCGTIRTFDAGIRTQARERIKEIAEGVALAFGGSATVNFRFGYPATVNHPDQTEKALAIAERVAGAGNVDREIDPSMGGEDFAYMLLERPGAYIFIGNGPEVEGQKLHQVNYDFNDEILPVGASYWAQLVEDVLARAA